jgi:hypothetical protein
VSRATFLWGDIGLLNHERLYTFWKELQTIFASPRPISKGALREASPPSGFFIVMSDHIRIKAGDPNPPSAISFCLRSHCLLFVAMRSPESLARRRRRRKIAFRAPRSVESRTL